MWYLYLLNQFSWKSTPIRPFYDLWPLKKRSDEEVSMNTFNLWFKTNKLTPYPLKSVKVENFTPLDLYLTFDPWMKGQTKRSQWKLLIYGTRRTIWHLKLWNRLKLKIGPQFDLVWPLTPEGKVGRRGHHEHFWSMDQDEQFDISTFEIGQTWRFDLLRKGLMKRSPWTSLIAGSIRTIWYLNLWNRLKLKI